MGGEGERRPTRPLITRVHPTSDENPPWAGIYFTEPVDSDVLAEQLKEKYPECRTLRERKHMAAIDFLKDELEKMQKKTSPFATPGEEMTEHHFRKISRSGSNIDDAPADVNRRESVSASNTPESSLHLSVRVDNSRPHIERSPSADNPPLSASSVTAGQQFVFNAVGLQPIQPRTKRKMTTEERSAYKETRKRGACPKCRRQKGKCTHGNDAVMDLSSPEETRVIPKRKTSASPVLERLETTKMYKIDRSSEIHQSSPSESNHQQINHHSVIGNQMDVSNAIRDVPGRTEMVPGNEQWGGTGNQTAMYVPPTGSMEAYGRPPSSGQPHAWPAFSASAGMDSFMSEFQEEPSHPGAIFPVSSPLQGSNMYPFGTAYHYDQWSNNQVPRTENDDPP